MVKFSGGGTPSRDIPAYWKGNIPWASPKDMKVLKLSATEEYLTDIGLRNSTSNLVPPGALLLVVRSGILKHTIPAAINTVPISLNQDMKALRVDEQRLTVNYLNYVVAGKNNELLFEWAKQGATVESLEQEYLENSVFPLPTVDEQTSIANFLDHETAKIDTLIEKQQQLIKLLKEKRQAVISHAVTKGLNPDAPMKDSGVEWLGEVPEHWVSTSIKNCCYVNDGNHGEEYPTESDFVDGDVGVPFIRAGDFNDFKLTRNDLKYISFEKNEAMRKGNLRTNDILFVNRGATIGKLCMVTEAFAGANLNSQIAYLRVENDDVDRNYLIFFLSSIYVQTKVIAAIQGGALPQYPLKHISNLDIWHADIGEQLEISSYLHAYQLKNEQLIDSCQVAIELMRERRTALISAAVTGKIDVRNWQPPESSSTSSMDAQHDGSPSR